VGEITYLEFFNGYVQQPCYQLDESLGGRRTKTKLASEFKTDLNVIRRITDFYFPLIWTNKQALKSCYSKTRINIRSDDGYYQWFLILCLGNKFRFPGQTKINHSYLLVWIENYKILFSWEMFFRDMLGFLPSKTDLLRQLGEIRFSPEQIETNYLLLERIQKNEPTRIAEKSKHYGKSPTSIIKPAWLGD